MGFSNCGGCYSMPDYEACDAHFKRTPWPQAKHRGERIWGSNQRPLDSDRAYHYRIEKHDSPERIGYSGERVPQRDFYDVCLYRTVMARYHKPLEDGSRCVEYTNHGTSLSSQFKWRVTRMRDVLSFGDICVPVGYKELGTTIWLDAAGSLIKEKSYHLPVYKDVQSAEQKAWRAKLRASTKNLAALLELGMDQALTLASCTCSWHHPGRPFSSNTTAARLVNNGYNAPLRNWDGELAEDTTVTVVEALQQLWTSCHEQIVAKRDWASNDAPVKPAEVTRSWYAMLDKLNPERSEQVRIPDFPTADQLPKKFHF